MKPIRYPDMIATAQRVQVELNLVPGTAVSPAMLALLMNVMGDNHDDAPPHMMADALRGARGIISQAQYEEIRDHGFDFYPQDSWDKALAIESLNEFLDIRKA